MEKSFSCLVNRLLDVQLLAGNHPEGKSMQQSGFDLFELLPYMAVPLLVVMIGGLYVINSYRKRTLNTSAQSGTV
ncbi:hypothetical protein [Chitinophaga niabensis]|uniref:Uncharacterized protein n=1 Tax=Chitinophaga niabensis TaxID=536979 RepID=A0A1N6JHD3_9BACT|nr:hypothetical protein [Chitinophaga niabensis]SIO43670.1 hypothetical protein SAMN04488055_4016 [Chitinophaga niabensis]